VLFFFVYQNSLKQTNVTAATATTTSTIPNNVQTKPAINLNGNAVNNNVKVPLISLLNGSGGGGGGDTNGTGGINLDEVSTFI
jgi:hypothetical protein